MELGTMYQNIECTDLSTDFLGICFIDNRKVFVENFLPGEIASIKITDKKSKYVRGVVTELTKTSAMRANSLLEENPTSYFGGCDLQMVNYDAQLTLKKQLVEKTAKLQAKGATFTFEEVVPSDKIVNYRNRTHYHLYYDKISKEIKAGFFGKGTREYVEVKEDFLADNHIFMMLQIVLQKLNKHYITIENIKEEIQGLKAVMFRYAELTNEMLIIFISSTSEIVNLEKVAVELKQENTEITGILLNINTKNRGAILGNKTKPILGNEMIHDKIGEQLFNIPATAFYQVNTKQMQNIYQEVINLLQNHNNATLIDFYCGIGTLSLMLANQVKKVIGIDIVGASIKAAKQNTLYNSVENARFITADVDTFMEEYERDGNEEIIAILDPPRNGCSPEFIQGLTKLEPEKIVYVSCNAKTLARDLQLFENSGYSYSKIKLYDMFPQTLHVESIVELTKTKK